SRFTRHRPRLHLTPAICPIEEVLMHQNRRWRPSAYAALALLAVLPLGPAAAQERTLNTTLSEQKSSVQDAARSQARIAQLADQTTELLGEYRVVIQRLDRVRIYNENLQNLV